MLNFKYKGTGRLSDAGNYIGKIYFPPLAMFRPHFQLYYLKLTIPGDIGCKEKA
jgi:hypothetical protein